MFHIKKTSEATPCKISHPFPVLAPFFVAEISGAKSHHVPLLLGLPSQEEGAADAIILHDPAGQNLFVVNQATSFRPGVSRNGETAWIALV